MYSHPEFPNIHPKKVMEQLRQNVQHNWIWMLTPSWLYKHIQIIHQKKIQGQPISFTDFFGYLVGETILRDVSITWNPIDPFQINNCNNDRTKRCHKPRRTIHKFILGLTADATTSWRRFLNFSLHSMYDHAQSVITLLSKGLPSNLSLPIIYQLKACLLNMLRRQVFPFQPLFKSAKCKSRNFC